MPRRTLPAVLALGVLVFAACSGSPESAGEAGADPPAADENLTAKPTFEVPSDESPPAELAVRELVLGDGEPVEPGDTAIVDYVGKAWSTGEEFDASWDRGTSYSFTVGAGDVIAGWERGILGEGLPDVEPMRVGGRRMLIIPPELGYGDRGAGGIIAPGETLVFVVDLRAVE